MKYLNLKIILLFFLFFSSLKFSYAIDEKSIEEKRPEEVGKCEGFLYIVKKDDTPVYNEADLSSEVVGYLKAGEKVCYIGEKNEFAILHWRLEDKEDLEKGRSKLSFSRLVDLVETKEYQKGLVQGNLKNSDNKKGVKRQKSFVSRVKGYFSYMLSGGVAEDGLSPYRPAMDILRKKK